MLIFYLFVSVLIFVFVVFLVWFFLREREREMNMKLGGEVGRNWKGKEYNKIHCMKILNKKYIFDIIVNQ